MKDWKLVLIPFVLVILAVVATLFINWWPGNEIAPGPRYALEDCLEGVGDWAKAELGLRMRKNYTFTMAEVPDETIVDYERTYIYRLSDGSVYGYFAYQLQSDVEVLQDGRYVRYYPAEDCVNELLTAEAEHLGKELYLDNGYNGTLFFISDDPETLLEYYNRCIDENFYRK